MGGQDRLSSRGPDRHPSRQQSLFEHLAPLSFRRHSKSGAAEAAGLPGRGWNRLDGGSSRKRTDNLAGVSHRFWIRVIILDDPLFIRSQRLRVPAVFLRGLLRRTVAISGHRALWLWSSF